MLALARAVTVGGVLQLVYQLRIWRYRRWCCRALTFATLGRCGGQTDGAGDFGRFRQSDLLIINTIFACFGLRRSHGCTKAPIG